MAVPETPAQGRLRLRDRCLDHFADDLLTNDPRLRDLRVNVTFDRGVAHVTGAADSRAHLALLRDLLGRLDGVYAVWDRVAVAGRQPVVLDLGCGDTLQQPGSVGIDWRPGRGVAVIADLASGIPVRTSSVDRIFTVHVLEHLLDYLPLLDECHRVLRPDGVLHVLAPWWQHVNAVADPTHVRFFDPQTIKSICERRDAAYPWRPLHAACDGATVFADLVPARPGDDMPGPAFLARFFD
ncbi:class I SAM-dependent methyltransferase [Polymorphospora rubra]|uniref:class I SAM-dependent methyltransferase n=1 Tax=Polymorphospora rubra TaxID=338584 RepID=UPI003F4D691B